MTYKWTNHWNGLLQEFGAAGLWNCSVVGQTLQVTLLGGVHDPSGVPVWFRVSNTLQDHATHTHDDIIKWKRYWPFVRGIHWSPVNFQHKGQWRRALMFPLICTWINGWVNNPEAGDLRCHHAHYDIIVICGYHSLQQIPSHTHQSLSKMGCFVDEKPGAVNSIKWDMLSTQISKWIWMDGHFQVHFH